MRVPESTEAVGRVVIDAALQIHTKFGPGLLEGVYEEALAIELRHRDLVVARQTAIALSHRDTRIAAALRIDLFVAGCVIVEVKSVQKLLPVHMAQLLTYLRLSDVHLGFLLNFNSMRLRDGIRRVVA